MRNLSPLAEAGLKDLFLFANEFWGLQLEEQPHRWMCDEMMKTLDMKETPFLVLDVPRGCYKTSVVTAGAVWQYLRQLYFYDNPYHRIIYCSNTLALGESFLTLIENILRSGGKDGKLSAEYGDLWKKPDRENRKSSRQKEGIFLKPRMDRGEIASVKEPNFFIGSIGALPIGFHADGAILDDVNNKKNVSTPEQLKKTHEFYRQVYPIINTTDRIGNPAHVWMCCTPWHDNDVRGMIIREEEEKRLEDSEYASPWRIVKATAHMEDGSLFFPTKLSQKELDRLKDHMGEEYWAAYEGSPVGKQDSVASADQIRYRPRDEFPPLRWCRITVDPNQHSEARVLGCYAAVILGGYDQYAKLWIWDIRASREWDTGKLIDILYDVQAEHPSWPIFIEDAHMVHFDHAVNLEYVRRMQDVNLDGAKVPTRLKINWVPAPRNMSKYERWQNALKPRFQSGSIYFAQEIAHSIKAELENEVTRGMASRFKDILDALALMENGIIPRYKSDGRGEKIQETVSQNNPEHRKFTFGDAFGDRIVNG
jgi:hypothetical protein